MSEQRKRGPKPRFTRDEYRLHRNREERARYRRERPAVKQVHPPHRCGFCDGPGHNILTCPPRHTRPEAA